MKIYLIMLSLIISSVNIAQTKIELPSFFSDNMVFQRNSEVNIWGKAKPNSQIKIESDWGENATTIVKENSIWKTSIQTPEAGGPYNISITDGSEKVILANVLIGEVWLCSGQSNMEMPLAGWPPNDLIHNSEQEISEANYPNIRLFTPARSLSVTELDDINGSWKECSPQTAQNFSATAYFFGRELYKELNIPIGLIHSSWGGTPAEAWTEVSFLKDVPGYEDYALKLKDMLPRQKEFKTWLESHKTIEIKDVDSPTEFLDIDFEDGICAALDFDDTSWSEMNLPTPWEQTDVGSFDGVIWFRKNIEIPQEWIGKDLMLELGPIDDMDAAFINGKKVGGYETSGNWQALRKYKIASELVTLGSNTIAVRVIDTQGGGGFAGSDDQMKIYSVEKPDDAITLSGSWKYLPIAEYVNNKFFLFGVENNTYVGRPGFAVTINSHSPTLLYNAMIAPIAGYNLRGAIWYQGESNVGRADQYRILFPTMIQSWRNVWGQGDFPFYFVQIAPYNYENPDSPESGVLRESQLAALDLKNTGVAVTLDIGVADNIHPPYKQDVGKRLALWALANDYGKSDLVYSGPIFKSLETVDEKIILSFEHVGGGLTSMDKPLIGFTIAGKDSTFIEADAIIQENKVIVSSSNIKNPVAVRYAWKNVPDYSLFNKEGLPAPTFRTDDW